MGRQSGKALIALWLCFAACVKDTPPAARNTLPVGASGDVYIVCQGDLGQGNASLYAWNPQNDSVYGDIYMAANRTPLGDVFQSMTRIGGNFFLCVDNSDKIVVIIASGYGLVATIGVPQPRFVLPVGNNKAYASSLFHNKVYVINTQTLSLTDSIALPNADAEGMCLYNNDAVVTTWDTAGNHIYLVDITTDRIVQSIEVAGYAPQAVLTDKDQMLWVLAGDQPEGRTATLTRVDPSSGDMLASYAFPAAADPLDLVINNTRDTLYFIEANYYGGSSNNGIYRMGIYDAALPPVPFLQAASFQYFYALGISPATGNIFVGDPKGFVQNGSVSVYRPSGVKVDSFNVGLGPGGFYFDQ